MCSVRVVVVLVVLLASGCGPDRSPDDGPDDRSDGLPGHATVERIVDGDTIDVSIGGSTERVRLIGIDTPEIAHDAFGDRPANEAECYGPEAAAFTSALVPPGTAIRIERDVVSRDDYGRLLGYVHRVDDEVFVNLEIVRRGYARPLTIAPNETYREDVVRAAREAEREELGLWSACR